MAVRSIVVKKPLIGMMARRFPDFPYVDEWTEDRGLFRIYGFVRKRPGYWYDYLTLARRFEDGKGALSIFWGLGGVGCGFNPDFYAWSTGDLWRMSTSIHYDWGDLFGPPRPQTRFHGPNQPVRYQNGGEVFLEEALEVLAEKIEQYALPELDKLAAQPPSPELARWQRLAAQIMPQIEELAARDPAGHEEMKLWIKQKARRWRESVDEGNPPRMARWREEISRLPGFAEEWDSSQYLRDCVFGWFIHAFYLRP